MQRVMASDCHWNVGAHAVHRRAHSNINLFGDPFYEGQYCTHFPNDIEGSFTYILPGAVREYFT